MYLFEFSLNKGGGTGGWYYPSSLITKKILKKISKNKILKKIFYESITPTKKYWIDGLKYSSIKYSNKYS